jgi:parvulin-like peptidyl-prolyl isomerase
MTEPSAPPAVTLGGVSLPATDFLHLLHQRGRLLPMLREAAVEQLLLRHAAQAGLTVAPEELQRAADHFRQRHGLASAEKTHAWLGQQHLSVADFEAPLERDLLIEKFKDHLTRDRIAGHFAAHKADYAAARLRLILVARDDLARELLSQVRDEGRDFAALAREHSEHPSRAEGGALGIVRRRQLPAAVAAAVSAARPGQVVGPLATPQGFHLVLVEAHVPAQLDGPTSAIIRQELFDAWLKEQLNGAAITYPLLDALGCDHSTASAATPCSPS